MLPEHHTHTHHEHRAPTDASVALLREMEQAAEKKLLDSVRLADCEIDCVIHHQQSVVAMDHHFVIDYRIGSKRVRLPVTVVGHKEHDEILGELRDALALSVAAHLLAPALKSLGRLNF